MKLFCRRKCFRSLGKYNITSEELQNKIKQGAILLDVRSKQEYDEGHIQGAINIPEYEVSRQIEKIIPDKKQLIVVYCQSGGRSKNVFLIMQQKGYNNIYHLYGGLDNLI